MMRTGVVFYAFFGLGWLLAGLGHFGGSVVGAAGVAGLALVVAMLLTARRLVAAGVGDDASDEDESELDAAARKRFGQVNAVQWGLIVAIAVVFSALGLPWLVMPLVAVVVGLHFLPLATVFGDPRLRLPGLVLTAIGLVGIVAHVAGATPGTVFTIVGVGCALTLWATASWVLLGMRRAA